jgi:phosphatidylserine/phosphatidylglycerophosphate/cardiolipin synthase-like enzyme
MEAALRARGIVVRRAVHPANVPMHDKFVLIDVHGSRQAILGSFNWTTPSLRYNREITAFCRHELLLDALDARWTELRQRCIDRGPAPGSRPPTG